MNEHITGAAPLPFRNHPDRQTAIQEAHDRPYLPLRPPATIHHLAFLTADDETRLGLYAAVFGLETAGEAPHTIREDGDLIVRLEPHTEFMTLSLIGRAGPAEGAARLTAIAARTPASAELLVALRLRLVDRPGPASDATIGGILRGDLVLATTCRPGPDGFIDFEVAAPEMGPSQLGRRIQRLLEAETYRTVSLIGIPEARRFAPVLNELEGDLADVTEALTKGAQSDEAILTKLQHLSARTEAMRSATSYRFAASRAYAKLVEERLETLLEAKLDERATLSGFITASLAPAVRTITSTERRQDELSQAIGRALDVLRTRVDVSMDKANQEIMRTMNERQHRQLVLSEAVEGLSVIAISYYLLGLLAYPVRALKAVHVLPVSEYVALGVLAPFVALGVYAIMRRIRARWDADG
ncbi:DUF3422 domain-containing protein [Acuticoccus sp. I52.16.1]|uniref:DUF3422 domain-containing protein n=1 Tax=Acuticoccus sp. I52.16.1 TaxID=2928472 RepID=UPI001FD11248|nr:DUF3422 domain-containing protein [Acuticoccus sp. I52.16.1]UOM36233.1 DUF3422 domain-containing protein [Acuticoccus sp. I52.16.1]